jgi:hypothetical protein
MEASNLNADIGRFFHPTRVFEIPANFSPIAEKQASAPETLQKQD